MADPIFEPLSFRNLTVKNRLFRSNVSGRFDNYDGSGSLARINWETRFARGGVGAIISSFVPVHARGRILPNYAMIDADDKIPFWREVGKRVHDLRLQVHPATQPRRQAARHRRNRVPEILEFDIDKPDPLHGFDAKAMTAQQIGDVVQQFGEGARARSARRARWRRTARRKRLPDHAVPQLGHQRPQG